MSVSPAAGPASQTGGSGALHGIALAGCGSALPRARIALTLARKALGFRTLMRVIGTDASIVRGSHGRLPACPADGPVFLCTDGAALRDRLAMTDVRDALLDLVAAAG